MQYLLTEIEYVHLLEKAKGKEREQKQELQEFCTMVANTLPVDWGWGENNPKPWECVITVEEEEDGEVEWYCDTCPARKICPYEYKHYSK